MNISMVPYGPQYDLKINELESIVSQGKHVRLKIIKDHFLSRSELFNAHFACLALNNNQTLVGTSIGAETKILINGESHRAGYAFDVKVHPAFRKRGIGSNMAKYTYKNYFSPHGLRKNFITLKSSNIAVIKLSVNAVKKVWLYNFVYLTIPTSVLIEEKFHPGKETKFNVDLFDLENQHEEWFTKFDSGLGYLHTWKAYKLKIEKINWLYRQGMALLKFFDPGKKKILPGEGDHIEFATLYRHSQKNISEIGEVLMHLSQKGIGFLLVCCRKNDSIYKYLKKFSINTYGYYILSDFPLVKTDSVTIDVRCL